MINVGAVVTNPLGACSYYRSGGPLSKIKEINFKILDKGNWLEFSSIDILYLERPATQSAIAGINLAKNFNIPIWIDFDDDLMNIPEWNGAAEFYNKKENMNAVIHACKMADVITVSSSSLVEIYGQYNPNTIVIPNAWNDFNFKLRKEASENKIINWRGSATHRGDLLEYKDSMLAAANVASGWMWSWMGKEHWMVSDYLNPDRVMSYPEMEIVNFFNTLFRVSPSIQIVPLKDNIFNRAKSNISWIEGTYGGAACLAPKMPEWDRPGIYNYSTEEEFTEGIIRLSADGKLRRKMWQQSADYIEEFLLLSKINEKRKAIISQLL